MVMRLLDEMEIRDVLFMRFDGSFTLEDGHFAFTFLAIGCGFALALMYSWIFESSASFYITSDNEWLGSLVKKNCPTLFCFEPTTWLFEGNLQTIWTAFCSKKLLVNFDRLMVETDDGGVVGIDIKCSFKGPEADAQRLIVVLHGLTGGSRDQYVQTVASSLLKAHSNYRTAVAVVHARGCGDTMLKTPVTVCAGFTKDIRFSIEWLHERFPMAKIVLVGFSLGGNILVNYLGEESRNVKDFIVGAVSVGAPYDLYSCALELQNNWFKRFAYSKTMTKGLVGITEKFKSLFEAHETVCIDEVLQSENVWQFDNLFTRKIFGYKTTGMYYREASSIRKLPYVSVPLICLHAFDDPIVPGKTLLVEDFISNSNILLIMTSKGGHLGWFSSKRLFGIPNNNWQGAAVSELVTSLFCIPIEKRQVQMHTSPRLKLTRLITLYRTLIYYYKLRSEKHHLSNARKKSCFN